jgi:hypothetical protein
VKRLLFWSVLAAALAASVTANAQSAQVITLACNGTAETIGGTLSGESVEQPFAIGLVINLTDRTIVGLDDGVRIDQADATFISFSGKGSSVSVTGGIDRITGIMMMVRTISDTPTTLGPTYVYHLHCKPKDRLF